MYCSRKYWNCSHRNYKCRLKASAYTVQAHEVQVELYKCQKKVKRIKRKIGAKIGPRKFEILGGSNILQHHWNLARWKKLMANIICSRVFLIFHFFCKWQMTAPASICQWGSQVSVNCHPPSVPPQLQAIPSAVKMFVEKSGKSWTWEQPQRFFNACE